MKLKAKSIVTSKSFDGNKLSVLLKFSHPLAIPLIVSISVHLVIYGSYQTFKCYRWGLSQQGLAKLIHKPAITLPKLLDFSPSRWLSPSASENSTRPSVLLVTLDPVMEIANPSAVLKPEKQKPFFPPSSSPRMEPIVTQEKQRQTLERPLVPRPETKPLSPVTPAAKALVPKPPENIIPISQPGAMPQSEATENFPEGHREQASSQERDRTEQKPGNASGIIQPGRSDFEELSKPVVRGGTEPMPVVTNSVQGSAGSESYNRNANLVRPPNLARYYPYHARAKDITGTTRVWLELDQRGEVVEAKIASSKPIGVFETAALRMARTLKFQPACENGKPVGSEFTVTIEWKLKP